MELDTLLNNASPSPMAVYSIGLEEDTPCPNTCTLYKMTSKMRNKILRTICDFIYSFVFLVKLNSTSYLRNNVIASLDAYHVKFGIIAVT